ncbi:MAG: methionyl-tRNA formyltransferase [Candidatus Bruticola sp.]
MRILYMGTPQFAVPALRKLAERFEVVGVVTQPDKPKGRGHKLAPPPVKVTALELGLPVYQPLKVRDPEFLGLVKQLNPDLILVAAYAKLIPKTLLELPRLGCVNLHPSLLPRHRGAIPVQAAIIYGDKVTGVSTFIMEEGYDTGPILMSRETAIGPQESGIQLMERLAELGADLLVETALGLEAGALKAEAQDGEFNYTKPFQKEDLFIDWYKDSRQIADFVRALYDEPEAAARFQGQVVKIGRASAVDFAGEGEAAVPGQIIGQIKGRGYVVATGKGAVVLELVKPSGKGWMDGASFMAGRRLQIGDILET